MRRSTQRMLTFVLSLSMAVSGFGQLHGFADTTDNGVAQGTSGPVISEFAELAVINAGLNTLQADLPLPEFLDAVVDTEDAAIAVTEWKSKDDTYTPEIAGNYIFVPVIAEKYSLAEGVSLPEQTVAIGTSDVIAEPIPLQSPYLASDAGDPPLFSTFSFFDFFAGTQNYGDQLYDERQQIVYDSLVDKLAGIDAPSGQYPTNYYIQTDYFESTTLTTKNKITADNLDNVLNDMDEASMRQFASLGQVVVDAFLYDYPEVFWLDFDNCGFSAFVAKTGDYTFAISSLLFFIQADTATYSNPKQTEGRMLDAVYALRNGVSSSASDYDKVKYFHDKLATQIDYNLNGWSAFQIPGAVLSPYQVVCEGYAKAFKFLCDAEEIPCVLVVGEGLGDSGLEDHMWNYVLIDGAWYAVDVTWDDQTEKPAGQIFYDYFLAGADSVAGGMTFTQTHQESGDFSGGGWSNFTYPTLSRTAYVPNATKVELKNITPPAVSGSWTYGSTLSTVATPSGGVFHADDGSNTVVQGTYRWLEPGGRAGSGSGTGIVTYEFIPNDGARYKTYIENISVPLSKKLVTVKANDVSVLVGEPVPTTFTYTYDGFVFGDTAQFLGLAPTATCAITDSSAVRSAPIVVTPPADTENYTFAVSDTPGMLSVVASLNVDSVDILWEGTIYTDSLVFIDAEASMQLTAQITDGATLTQYPAAWSSSNPDVAVVDGNGLVSGRSVGSTVITATVKDKTARLEIVVYSFGPANDTPGGVYPTIQIPEASMPDGVASAGDLVLIVEGMSSNTSNEFLNNPGVAAAVSRFGGSGSLYVYITLFDMESGESVQPNGPVTITLPYPTGTDSSYDFQIVHMKDDGTVEIIVPIRHGDYLEFSIDSFSLFAILYKGGSTTSTPTSKTSSGSSGGSGSGSGWSGSRRDAASLPIDSQWNSIKNQIRQSSSGDTIKISLKDNGDRVPYAILDLLQGKNVTLTVRWPDGRTVRINGKDIGNLTDFTNYTYKQLVALFGDTEAEVDEEETTVAKADKTGDVLQNPATGGDAVPSAAISDPIPATRPGVQSPPETVPAPAASEAPATIAKAVTPPPVLDDTVPMSRFVLPLIALLALASGVCGGIILYRRRKSSSK